PGLTNVYIHYKNIPGYWDGDFVDQIEKAPVVYKDQLVGIGTNAPQEKLHVAGKVRVDKELTVGEKATVDKLRVEKDMSVGAKVTVDNLRVDKDVSVGSTGVFYVDAAN